MAGGVLTLSCGPLTHKRMSTIEDGTPEHFFSNPTHERTKSFLSTILCVPTGLQVARTPSPRPGAWSAALVGSTNAGRNDREGLGPAHEVAIVFGHADQK